MRIVVKWSGVEDVVEDVGKELCPYGTFWVGVNWGKNFKVTVTTNQRFSNRGTFLFFSSTLPLLLLLLLLLLPPASCLLPASASSSPASVLFLHCLPFRMSLLGRIRSLYLAIGLAVLTLISFGACGLTRLLFGHRVAKRVHELILGQGTYYWMRVTGAWHLTVKGKVPDTKETFVIVANHASTSPSSYSLFKASLYVAV